MKIKSDGYTLVTKPDGTAVLWTKNQTFFFNAEGQTVLRFFTDNKK